MKMIDVRFSEPDIASFRKMIGRKMLKVKCDPFLFSSSVYGVVGICTEDTAYAFTNLVESADYFGQNEDVAIFRMKQMPFDDIRSMVQWQEMIVQPVDSVIREVQVVNERQELFKNGTKIYETWVTRGIIFQFKDGHELSFEKNIWFSEDISVEKGYDLITRFTPVSEFEEGWSGEYIGRCYREIIKISSQ